MAKKKKKLLRRITHALEAANTISAATCGALSIIAHTAATAATAAAEPSRQEQEVNDRTDN